MWLFFLKILNCLKNSGISLIFIWNFKILKMFLFFTPRTTLNSQPNVEDFFVLVTCNTYSPSATGPLWNHEVATTSMRWDHIVWSPAPWSSGATTGLVQSTIVATTMRLMLGSSRRLVDCIMFMWVDLFLKNPRPVSLNRETQQFFKKALKKFLTKIRISFSTTAYLVLQLIPRTKRNPWERLASTRMGRMCRLHCSFDPRDALSHSRSNRIFTNQINLHFSL